MFGCKGLALQGEGGQFGIRSEFFRRFSLPDTADSQSVKARFNNGVLEVSIPKQAQVLPRRINVEAH